MKTWINKLLVSSVLLPGFVFAEPIPEIDCLIEPNMTIELSSAVSGVLDTILVDRSDSVKKGQILATLKSDVMRVKVKASNENLKLSILEQKRAIKLYKDHVITLSEKQKSDHERKLAELELKQAKASLEQRVIRSPIDGIIADRYLMPGEYIEDNPILKVAQLNPLRIEVVSPVENFGRVKVGMHARITTEFGSFKNLIGEVVVVDKVIDAASGTFGIRLELDNKDNVVPGGLKCTVNFIAETDDPYKTKAQNITPSPTIVAKTKPVNVTKLPVLPVTDELLMCASIGPYNKQEKLNSLMDKIDSEIKQSYFRAETKNKTTHLVVSDDVFDSIKKAKVKMHIMQEDGVSDIAILNQEGSARIALGLFKNQSSAQKLAKVLQAKGYQVHITPRERKLTSYWADIAYLPQAEETLNSVIPKTHRSACENSIKLSLLGTRQK